MLDTCPSPEVPRPRMARQSPLGWSLGGPRTNAMSRPPQVNKFLCFTQFSMLRPQTAFPGLAGVLGQQTSFQPLSVRISENKEGRFTRPALPLPSRVMWSSQPKSREGWAPRPHQLCRPLGAGRSSWQSRERGARSQRGTATPERGGRRENKPLQPQTLYRKGACPCTQGTNTGPTFVTRLIICGLHKRQMEQR